MGVRVAIFGAGGQAKIVVDALLRSGAGEVVGYLDDGIPPGATRYGYPVLGPRSSITDLSAEHGIDAGIISFGDNHLRGTVADEVEGQLPGFVWQTVIHPSVWIAGGCQIGHGVLMMAGSIVNPDCTLGDHSTLGTRASLDHDSVLGHCASLAPNVATGGECRVGDYSAIGIGASISHGRTVGDHAVVGAGSVVTRDIPDRVVAYGVPARPVRSRCPGDPYL